VAVAGTLIKAPIEPVPGPLFALAAILESIETAW